MIFPAEGEIGYDLYIPCIWGYFATGALKDGTVEEAVEKLNALCDKLNEEFHLQLNFELRGMELRNPDGDIVDKM